MEILLLGMQRYDQIKAEYSGDLRGAILAELEALPNSAGTPYFLIRIDCISRCWEELTHSDPGFELEPQKGAVEMGMDLDLVDPNHPNSAMSARHQINSMALAAKLLANGVVPCRTPYEDEIVWLCVETMAKRWIDIRDQLIDNCQVQLLCDDNL